MARSPKKNRVSIPPALAAQILFESDRVCCVCRTRGKPVQIHHIDEDPSNNDPRNLSVLCFDCHRETQIRGGFDRKLDADQVILYRDSWVRTVADRRATSSWRPGELEALDITVEAATSLAEIYRENEEWELLAMHYDHIGNSELRDKYIEKVLEDPDTDARTVVFYRANLQGRPDLVSKEVGDEAVASLASDDLQRARVLTDLRRFEEAAESYLEGIKASLADGNQFTAAYYLKELSRTGITDELFKIALNEDVEKGDIWWQHRCLEELGWERERAEMLLSNAEEIERSENLELMRELAWARNDAEGYLDLEKKIAEASHLEMHIVQQQDANSDGQDDAAGTQSEEDG